MNIVERSDKFGIILKYGNVGHYFERFEARRGLEKLQKIVEGWDSEASPNKPIHSDQNNPCICETVGNMGGKPKNYDTCPVHSGR